MGLGGVALEFAEHFLLGNQLGSRMGIAGHEHSDGEPQVGEQPLTHGADLFRAFGGEGQAEANPLGRQLH